MKRDGQLDRSRLPVPRSFFEIELSPARIGRTNSKAWAQCRCPFHDSKSKRSLSINLHTGAFRCFHCGIKGGDVIAWTRMRYSLDFIAACKKIGAWIGDGDLSATERSRLEQQERARQEEIAQAKDARRKQRRERLDVREELHTLTKIIREAADHLDSDPMNDQRWAVLASAFEQLREAELEYLRLSGFSEDDL